MWNLILDFKQYQEDLLELLEFEAEYAEHMASIEKCSLEEAMLKYTEWHYMHTTAPGSHDERLALMRKLASKEARRTFFEERVIPEQQKRFIEGQEEIRGSRAGFIAEVRPEYYSESPEIFLTLHFRNYFAPDSPFAHKQELANGLLQLIEEFLLKHPTVERVQCASWLNNVPDFLSLFPDEWLKCRVLCLPMEPSTGWWGSLIDRTGRFSRKRAELFKKCGGFSMPNMLCRCKIEDLLHHLRKERC
jgi:hypothetical protein